jgi:hypothetical protein
MPGAAMVAETPQAAEVIAVLHRPPLQEQILLVERVVVALMQVNRRRLYGGYLTQREEAAIAKRDSRCMGRSDRHDHLGVEVLAAKLLLVENDCGYIAGPRDRSLADRFFDGPGDDLAFLSRLERPAQCQRGKGFNALDDDIQCVCYILQFKLAQAELYLREPGLFLAHTLSQLSLFEPVHAPNLFGGEVVEQELANLFQ